MERRLAAIIVADIAGYSRMVAEDEAGTIERMRELRDTIIEPAIQTAGGRIVKRTGDGTLIEFSSVLAAAQAAIDVQRQLANIAVDDPEDHRFILRIGMHPGEVLVEPDGDIHGDGVNIAARLEALCAPGEILVSGAAWDHLEGRLDVRAEEIGLRELKNIPRKVALHRLIPNENHSQVIQISDPGKASLPLADKPSIVVLPFDDMSKDADSGFLADGLVEDITTALSRFRSLFVIARNTAFSYRGRAINVSDVGRELGVQYVLEGSVRRAGDRVRITAQLIDATADRHIWAEKFDRCLDDLFAIQDELTQAITGAVAPEMSANERALAGRKPPESLEAWELYHRGVSRFLDYDESGYEAAERHFRRGLEKSPNFAPLHVGLAMIRMQHVGTGRTNTPEAELQEGLAAVEHGLSLDPLEDEAYGVKGQLLFLSGQVELAIDTIERGLQINPNNAILHFRRSVAEMWLEGRDIDLALKHALESLRLSPFRRIAWNVHYVVGYIHLLTEPSDTSGRSLRHMLAACQQENGDWFAYLGAAALLAHHERSEEAKAFILRATSKHDGLTLEVQRAVWSSNQNWREDWALFGPMVEKLVPLGLPRG